MALLLLLHVSSFKGRKNCSFSLTILARERRKKNNITIQRIVFLCFLNQQGEERGKKSKNKRRKKKIRVSFLCLLAYLLFSCYSHTHKRHDRNLYCDYSFDRLRQIYINCSLVKYEVCRVKMRNLNGNCLFFSYEIDGFVLLRSYTWSMWTKITT